MKKILILLFTVLLLFTLAACAADPTDTVEPTEAYTVPEETPPTAEETPELPIPDENEDAGVGNPVNIAELIGRDFGEHRHLFGNLINWLGGPTTTNFIFDVGTSLTMKLDTDRPSDWLHDFDIQLQLEEPGWIQSIYVQFDEPENEGIGSFSRDEGFLGYEHSQRFHFNGIGYQSTLADVEAAFSTDSFNRAYVSELNIFGDYLLQSSGPPIPREGNVDIAVLDYDAEHGLIGRLDAVIYWNDHFAITFEFSADGRVIDMLVFSTRKE